jgi:hypothetical protein
MSPTDLDDFTGVVFSFTLAPRGPASAIAQGTQEICSAAVREARRPAMRHLAFPPRRASSTRSSRRDAATQQAPGRCGWEPVRPS